MKRPGMILALLAAVWWAAPGVAQLPATPYSVTVECDQFTGLASSYREGWRLDTASGGSGGRSLSCLRPLAVISGQAQLAQSGTYTIRVRMGCRASIELLTFDDVTTFTVNAPEPSFAAPAIQWAIVEAGEVQLSAGTHGLRLVHGRNGTGATEDQQIALVDNVELVLGSQPPSPPPATPPPTPPTAPDPPDGAKDAPLQPALRWQCTDPSGGAPTYQVALDTQPSFNALAATGQVPQFTPTAALQPGARYFWQVTASGAGGVTQGPVWTFTTTETAAAGPAGPAPQRPPSARPGDAHRGPAPTVQIGSLQVSRQTALFVAAAVGATLALVILLALVIGALKRIGRWRRRRAYLAAKGMRFCRRCGADWPEGAPLCPSCGASALAEAAAASTAGVGTCPGCSAPLAADDTFCGRCGTSLSAPAATGGRPCSQCGASLAAEDTFCGQCGTPIPGADAPAEAAPRCPACGEPVGAGEAFCGNCGGSLGAATAQ